VLSVAWTVVAATASDVAVSVAALNCLLFSNAGRFQFITGL